MMKTALTIAALLSIGFAGCTVDRGGGGGEPQQETDAPAPTNRIDIPATVRSNLGITFAKVQRRHVAGTIRISGAFELQPLARHEYRMTLPGRVELLVNQFDPVDPGTPLYRFRSPAWPELQSAIILAEQGIDAGHADIDVARAKLEEARATLAITEERLQVLARADFKRADLEAEAAQLRASLPRLEAELRRAETTVANAERTREQAVHAASAATGITEEQLNAEVEHNSRRLPAYRVIDWIDVPSTEPGVVESLAVTDGAFVEPPAVVISTVDPSKLRFRAMALQADLPRLMHRAESRIVPPTTPGIEIGDAVPAELTIGLEAHPEQRTVTLLATPEGSRDWIRPGISAFLEVVVDSTGGPALAIPRSAIVKDGIVHVFFRRDPADPNRAIRVEADLGPSDGRWVAIRSGLMLEDEVVLDGAYELKLASQQSGTSQKGGHFHADGTFHGEH
jgi:multidrug efflux pump subunit AcrA (membrane-fusion protein)